MQPPQANTLAAPRRAATQTDVTNQQIIRQNIQIHAQLRQQQQMYQDCLLENLELKTKVTGLETENARLSSDLAGLKVRESRYSIISHRLGLCRKRWLREPRRSI